MKIIKSLLAFAILVLLFNALVPAPAAADGVPTSYTPSGLTSSIYMIKAFDKDGEAQWSGTGWKLSEGKMMTAGHVCDTEGQDGFTFRAIGRWNQEYPITVIKFSRDPDLCLLSAPHLPGPSMSTLTMNPAYGQTVWYSGAPHGVFGDGTVPFAEGRYIGGNKVMIAGYPGASGSPMYTEAGVFGVLVAGWRGTHLIEFVPGVVVYQWLKE